MKTMRIYLVFAALLASFASQAAYESEAPVDFTLPQLHGDPVGLAELRPKWVVLNYWATWCAPCRKEIPDLSELHSRREDIIVLGLAFEEAEVANFDAFLAEFEPSYPILLVDVYAPPEPFGAPKALPTTIILDPEGFPVKTFMGPVTGKDIEAFIDAE
ncbi:MAG: TlpA disulfide reductase family protein [Lysobacterales bacterium]|jgi:thiol-disulfide isomerase/thioredoxin